MRLKFLEKSKKVYFIGIGGISMSALAKYLSVCGYEVSGSDACKNEQTETLAFYGIKAYFGVDGNREDLQNADVVVYTDAIAEDNTELQTAKQRGKQIYSRADFLSAVCKEFPTVLSVAGSHGKTTCTSICAHVLKSCEVPFTAHIGGEDSVFGNFYSTGDEYFLTEACEYKRNIAKISADVAVLLNIDKDHMECYENEAELVRCFEEYCKRAKTAFVCADDEHCKKFSEVFTFGIKNPLADYRATHVRANGEHYSFTVEEYGKTLCRIKMRAIGYCNGYNALAAFAAMRSLGFDEREIVRGIESFNAVKRRFEKIGEYHGASFICDYAHHPREIAATIATAERVCRGNLYVVFQPHTYSRTKLLLKEFISVLRPIKNLVLYKTYPAREKYDLSGSAAMLANMLGNCLYAENVYVLKTWIKKTVKERDIVLFLGAGDIYYAAQYLLREMG